jgi:hypothetical protein
MRTNHPRYIMGLIGHCHPSYFTHFHAKYSATHNSLDASSSNTNPSTSSSSLRTLNDSTRCEVETDITLSTEFSDEQEEEEEPSGRNDGMANRPRWTDGQLLKPIEDNPLLSRTRRRKRTSSLAPTRRTSSPAPILTFGAVVSSTDEAIDQDPRGKGKRNGSCSLQPTLTKTTRRRLRACFPNYQSPAYGPRYNYTTSTSSPPSRLCTAHQPL